MHLQRQDGPGERLDLQGFSERVAEREGPGTDLPAAAFHARAVLSVVDDATQGGELDAVASQLGDDFSHLFELADVRQAQR